MKIAIIGSGYTGLVAAYRLSQAGHEITIFEKNNDVGGLASGLEIEGTNLEKTYHHIFKTDTDIIELIKELGIENTLVWNKGLTANVYKGKIYPFNTPKDFLAYTPAKFIHRLKFGLIGLYLTHVKSPKKFVKISAYDWMNKYSGKSMMDSVWEPLLKGKFHNYYNKVSMAWLWARIYTRGKSKQPGDEMIMLGYVHGGFKSITDALIKKLIQKNVDIQTNVNIDFINEKEGRVELSVDKKLIYFDKLIATVPSYIFADLIKDIANHEYIDKLRSIKYLGAIVMVFSSNINIGDYYWYNINDVKAPFLVFLNHTNFIQKEKYNGKYIYYIGTYVPHEHKYFNMTDEEIGELWFNYLKTIFPEFHESSIIEKHIYKLKNAQHIVDLDYQSKIPDYITPLKNIYLSNFSQIYPEDRGTNFAVREGNNISKLILKNHEDK